MGSKSSLLGMLGTVVGGVLVALWFIQSSEEPALRIPGHQPAVGAATPANVAAPAPETAAVPPRRGGEHVERFDGHVVEGQLETDAQGQLVMTLDLRVLLDFFIATYQDLGVQGVRDKFAEYARQVLVEPALGQALQAYDQYALYLQNVQDVMQRLSVEGSDIAFMTQQQDTASQNAYFQRVRDNLDELSQLRRVYFNQAQHDAFFGFEEVYSRYSLERMSIMANEALSDAERQDAIDRLQAGLPPEIREFEQHAQRDYELFEKTEALRAQGASEADIHALRERYVGKEMADQMAQFEAQEQAWNQRYERYAEAVEALLAVQGLSAVEREQQIERLRAQHFSAQELEEVRARDEFRESLSESVETATD